MEENKEKKCCENGACENCKDKKGCCCCGLHCWYRKCPKHTKVLFAVIIVAALCVLASLFCGKYNYEWPREGRRFSDRGNMMEKSLGETGSGSITVNVIPAETPTGNTTTPPVQQ